MAAGDDPTLARPAAALAAQAYLSAAATEADEVEALARRFLAIQACEPFAAAETTEALPLLIEPHAEATAPAIAVNGYHQIIEPVAEAAASAIAVNGCHQIIEPFEETSAPNVAVNGHRRSLVARPAVNGTRRIEFADAHKPTRDPSRHPACRGPSGVCRALVFCRDCAGAGGQRSRQRAWV